MLSGEATNTNFIVFGLSRLGLKPTIYHTRGFYAFLMSVSTKFVLKSFMTQKSEVCSVFFNGIVFIGVLQKEYTETDRIQVFKRW